jgi:peptidoglycan hydrolase CwlO-like protein
MIMYKSSSILILFTSLVFFTTAVCAEEQNLKALQAQVAEVHNQIKVLQKENKELKEKLASREKEVSDYRATLEKLESEINALKESS